MRVKACRYADGEIELYPARRGRPTGQNGRLEMAIPGLSDRKAPGVVADDGAKTGRSVTARRLLSW